MNASHMANVPMRSSNPRPDTRAPASGRNPDSTTAESPMEINASASSLEDAPMSHGRSFRSSAATFFLSSAFIRCGGRVPTTPFTGPFFVRMISRSAAVSGTTTPPRFWR